MKWHGKTAALLSFATHAVLASVMLRAHASAARIDPPLEMDVIVEAAQPPPPPPPPVPVKARAFGSIDPVPNTVSHAAHAPSAALLVVDRALVEMPATPPPKSDGDCDGEDCIFEALERCRQGDGDGCVGVGKYYELGRGDPFSAIKWYVKGCGLNSRAACDAHERVAAAMPLGWDHHPLYAPHDDVERPIN